MNTRQLEIFLAIMRDGSVTAAANALAVSQPAVSKMLHHLEDQLGYALFERIGGRLVPTAEAELLYEDAGRVLREFEVLRDLAQRVGERRLGLLRIGVILPLAWSVLPAALTAFREAHPAVRVHLHTLPKREIAEALRVGGIDLALTLSPIFAPTVRTETLTQVEMAVLLPAGHRLAALETITPADLAGESLISYGSHAEIGPTLDEAFRSAQMQREVAIQVASSVAAVPLVMAGLGVALVDGLVDWQAHAVGGQGGIVKRPFRPRLCMGLMLATDNARPIPRLARDFVEHLRAQV